MEEKKIEFKTAILAKEKECNLPLIDTGTWLFENELGETFGCGFLHEPSEPIEDRLIRFHGKISNLRNKVLCTQSLLHTWIRENHGIYILVIPTITANWTFKSIRVISKIDRDVIKGLKSVSDLPPYKDVHGYDYSTYEDALEAGLVAALNEI